MTSDYGPDVYCPVTEGTESTHRPAGSRDPWFCMACGGTDHAANVTTAPKFRVDVKTYGENSWASNALRFDTEAEGLAYAKDLYSRWMLVDKMRIVPETTPDREPYVAGAEHPDWS